MAPGPGLVPGPGVRAKYTTMLRSFLLLCLIFVAACDRPGPTPAAAATPPGSTYTPDSTRAAQLAEFRAGLPELTALAGGAPSRDSLVTGLLAALATRDTATLNRLVLSRAEFAWLYYPTTQQALPPYDLDPATLWMLTSERGGRGQAKLLETLGGRTIPYVGHRCEGGASHEGQNTVYGPCVVRLAQAPGDTVESRLFGLVLERGGQWKFVSYANKLD